MSLYLCNKFFTASRIKMCQIHSLIQVWPVLKRPVHGFRNEEWLQRMPQILFLFFECVESHNQGCAEFSISEFHGNWRPISIQGFIARKTGSRCRWRQKNGAYTTCKHELYILHIESVLFMKATRIPQYCLQSTFNSATGTEVTSSFANIDPCKSQTQPVCSSTVLSKYYDTL